MNFKKWTLLFSCFGLVACGTTEKIPTITIVSPTPGQTVTAGEDVAFELAFEHFTLKQPPSHAGHHGKAMHPMHGDEDHMNDDMSTDTAPRAVNEGHFHIYLDDAAGDDHHVTQWVATPVYSLPASVAAGTHSFRIDLRDNEHHPLNIEATVEVQVVTDTTP